MSFKTKLLLCSSVCLVLFYFLCSGSSVNTWPITKDTQITKLVFFGDSLTTGYGLEDTSQSYPDQLSKQLKLPMARYGFNGFTTANALKEVDSLKNEPPSLVIVTLGGNDILRRLKLEETEKNLRAIVSRLQAMKHTVVFTEVLSLFDSKRHEMYKRLCTELKIAMVPDILNDMLNDTTALQADNIHPTAHGCGIIAQRVAKVLKDLEIVN